MAPVGPPPRDQRLEMAAVHGQLLIRACLRFRRPDLLDGGCGRCKRMIRRVARLEEHSWVLICLRCRNLGISHERFGVQVPVRLSAVRHPMSAMGGKLTLAILPLASSPEVGW